MAQKGGVMIPYLRVGVPPRRFDEAVPRRGFGLSVPLSDLVFLEGSGPRWKRSGVPNENPLAEGRRTLWGGSSVPPHSAMAGAGWRA